MISRRALLQMLPAAAAAKPSRLIIDTHLEVWTDDPRFPFAHPERPDFKRVDVQAPIENQVQQMKDFGLKYPQVPDAPERLRYWVQEHQFQGMRFSPIYHPKSTWLNGKESYPLWKQ